MEKHVRDNFFAPKAFEALNVDASKRSETRIQVLSLLRDPSPGDNLAADLGDQTLYERVLRVVTNDKIAINRNGQWDGREPGQSSDKAYRLLKRATPTGS